MKTTRAMLATILLGALLGANADRAEAGVHYVCTSKVNGKCPAPPVPPAPPAPPAAPALPMPPMPPEPPPIPEVPAEAHSACSGKARGARITYVVSQGETMIGVCASKQGKPVFQLREYRVED